MSEFYRFPAMAKLREYSAEAQVVKIIDEALEMKIAQEFWRYGGDSRDHEEDRRVYGMELMDVIHATETALRMEFGDEEVDELRDAVEKKNRDRGYYSKFDNDEADWVKSVLSSGGMIACDVATDGYDRYYRVETSNGYRYWVNLSFPRSCQAPALMIGAPSESKSISEH